MQPENTSRRSATSQSRRDQIVDAALELIATDGYEACTFQRIGERAGLSSTRLISYHFSGKDDLIGAVLAVVFETIGSFTSKRVVDHDRADEALADYLRTAVALNDTHRAEMRCLTQVVLHHRHRDDEIYGPANEHSAVGRVESILLEGQSAGLFGRFDAWIMATTIQRSVDGIAFMLQTKPDLDLDHYADELVTTFERATRA